MKKHGLVIAMAWIMGMLTMPSYANNAHGTNYANSQELSFEIRKQSAINMYPIALIPFVGDSHVGHIINKNLAHTDIKSTSQNLPARPLSSADFASTRSAFAQSGFAYVVTGAVNPANDGKSAIVFEVIDVATGRVIGGRQTQIADNTANGIQYAANVVSDKIHELITGIAGDFSSRIAFVEETGDPRNKISTLKVMDADGQNMRAIHQVQGSIFSPAWSPDGRRLAYAEQRPNGLPVIYIQDVDGVGRSGTVTPFRGNNLGATWSPDGNSILFSGSHENNDPAIYQLHLPSGGLKKLTYMTGAENSPTYAPDGLSFVFTADSGGRTQRLYRYDFNTGQSRPLSQGASANPRFSPDGKRIAYVAGSTLSVMNLGGGSQSIAPTSIHESASFSPSSTRIVYSSGNQSAGAITIRSLTSGESFSKTMQGRVRDPAWSPRIR